MAAILKRELRLRLKRRMMPRRGLFWFPVQDMRILADWPTVLARSLLYNGYYEPQTVAWLNENIEPDWWCVDIGANVGYLTAIMARRARHVLAFEPDPRLCQIIALNMIFNDLYNVSIRAQAVSDRNGTARFFMNREPLFSGLVGHDGLTDIIEVATVTLDSVIQGAHLIKIDVEGAENLVLRGMRHQLQRRDLWLIVEVEPDRPGFNPEVYDLLEGWRFKNLDRRNLLCWRDD